MGFRLTFFNGSHSVERARAVTVEFFGVARLHAGLPSVQIEAADLNQAILALTARLPNLEGTVFRSGSLLSNYQANLNGRRFVSDPRSPLAPGDSLLILSADAGG